MKEIQKMHVMRALEANVRFDGRAKDDMREVSIETGISKTAEGSAKVTIGKTIVLVGVKLSIDTPYPDTPENGNLMVNAELLPIASNEFERGPPSIDAIELARVMDRSIRESNSLDTKNLCIEAGEKVWTVICDICILNNDGNLFDASSIGMIAALKDARFPELKDGVIDYKNKTDTPLPIEGFPLAVTVWKMGSNIYVDPLPAEEEVFESRLTVASRDDGRICALQKGGDSSLQVEDVDTMTEIALQKAQQIRKQVQAAVKS